MFIPMVIAGDYQGHEIKTAWGGNIYINAKGGERIIIDSSTVKSYEVLEIDDKKSFSSGVARGLVGGAVFGGVGALAGVNSAKSMKTAKIKIQFKSGKCSLLYVDKILYDAIINKCFNLDTEEDTPTYQSQQTSYTPTHSSNKFCTNCGTQIVGDGKFCSSCGASTNNITNPQPTSAPIPTTSLYLESIGDNKDDLIRELNKSGLTLDESHKTVENAPCLVLYGVQMPKAEVIKNSLEELGAKVSFMDNADALAARQKQEQAIQEALAKEEEVKRKAKEQEAKTALVKEQEQKINEINDILEEKAKEIETQTNILNQKNKEFEEKTKELKTKNKEIEKINKELNRKAKLLTKPLSPEYINASKKIKTSFIILTVVAIILSTLFNIAVYDPEYGFSFAVIMTIIIAGILFVPFSIIALIARRKEIKEIRKYKKENK